MSGKALAGSKFNFAEWHEDMCPLWPGDLLMDGFLRYETRRSVDG